MLNEHTLIKVKAAIEGLIEAAKNKRMVSKYDEADSGGAVLVIGDKLFGLDYADPYIDLSGIDSINDESAPTILQAYAADQEFISDSELDAYLDAYRSEAEACNTVYQEEFFRHVNELEESIKSLRKSPKP